MSEEKLNTGSLDTDNLTEEKIQLKKPDMYRIVLLNDDYTPRDFVVWIIMRIFYKTEDESSRIMLEAHKAGKSTIGVYTFDIAKTKVTQVEQLAEKYEHPLKCVLEVESALMGSSGIDEYELDRVKFQAEKILMGLGFEKKQLEEKTSTLSGGWKMRIELAKLLLKEPNVLLLDEPTNHLDIQSIVWIENYLNNFNGTVVLVSHDKYLLDRMVDTIAELENGKIKEYKGNYSHYIVEKEEQRQIQLSTFKNQQKKVLETERFIERFRAKNTKATQVQSRVKMLKKMEIVDAPESYNKKIKLKFPEAKRSGRVVCEISEFSKEYKTQEGNVNIVFDNAGPLKIERGDKIALAGKNGEGKTTLAKLIVGIEKFNGEKELGHNVELAYYAQNQEDNLNLENTLYSEFVQVSPHFSDTQVRSMLGSFLFNEDDLEKKLKYFPGVKRAGFPFQKCSYLLQISYYLMNQQTTLIFRAGKFS